MTNQVIHGDCLEVPLPPNHFDTLITDPPYGLGFMGKDWDAGVPGKAFWTKFLDACKPGAFAFVFGGTRTYHRLACAIEDAGWEIRDCMSFLHDGNPITSPLLWITGQGFPKSHNFGCKCNEKKTDDSGDLCDLSQGISETPVLGKEMPTTLLQSIVQRKNESQRTNQAQPQRSGSLDRKEFEEFPQKNVGAEQSGLGGRNNLLEETRQLQTNKVCPMPGGVSSDGTERWIRNGTQIDNGETSGTSIEKAGGGSSQKSQSTGQSDRESGIIQQQSSPQKNRGGACPKCGGLIDFKGYGTALKPSVEMIVVAMKPLDGTFAHNAEKWGVGGLWIDGGRIGTETRLNKGMSQNKPKGAGVFRDDNWQPKDVENTVQGRWPANVILDENVADDESWKRYFYCPKASKKERDAGCEDLEEKKKWLAGGTGTGISARESITSRNNHPTVKPLALMEYLCKLSRTPQGGIVLDPFAGSGTTALACVNTDRKYVIIEKELEYCQIASARLGDVEIETVLPVNKPHSTDVQEPIKVRGYPSAPHENPSPNAEPGGASIVPPQQPLCLFCGGLLREAGTNWICLKCKKIYRHLI